MQTQIIAQHQSHNNQNIFNFLNLPANRNYQLSSHPPRRVWHHSIVHLYLSIHYGSVLKAPAPPTAMERAVHGMALRKQGKGAAESQASTANGFPA